MKAVMKHAKRAMKNLKRADRSLVTSEANLCRDRALEEVVQGFYQLARSLKGNGDDRKRKSA